MILTIKRDRFRFLSCSDRRSKIHPSPRSSSPITQRRLIAQNSSDSIRPLHQESILKRGNTKNETDRGDQETDTRETSTMATHPRESYKPTSRTNQRFTSKQHRGKLRIFTVTEEEENSERVRGRESKREKEKKRERESV